MYPIVEVPGDATEASEQLGTKFKFWYRVDGRLVMFKIGRPGTGENWAEKISCELCRLIGLPHADYEFARWRGHLGTVTPNFVPRRGRLVLGNELLPKFHGGYEDTKRFGQRQHTIQRVVAALRADGPLPPMTAPQGGALTVASDFFAGYILLDAWIGNTDRHHENWGVIVTADGPIHLAPTFDHASSLGRELIDARRTSRLQTADHQHSVLAYASRATSALYGNETDVKPLSTMDAFQEISKRCRSGGAFWRERLRNVTEGDIDRVIGRVPAELMSEPAREFAKRILNENRTLLLNSQEPQ